VLAFILLVLSSSIIKMNILGRLIDAPQLYSLQGDLKRRVYDNVLPHFFLVIAGAAVKLMFDYSRLQRRMAETAKEKAEAELNFLKSQINPHFLFNCLNAVYFLIDKNNVKARQSLHKFSDMLRYQLYEMKGAKIPVEKEISYLKDYVDMQTLRKDEHYSVSFNYSPQVSGFLIEPLLLIPFVENAFKHVSAHPDKNNFVSLDLARSNGQLLFTAVNSKDQAKAKEPYSGIGLNNVKRRLELLYPGKHELNITDDNEIYKVDLKLKIDS
jgi:LytS/YehU family sensor histidine kinase